MDSKDLENVMMVTELVAKVGIPMIKSILTAISKSSPTVEQIHSLRQTIKDPESYFENDGSIKVIDMNNFNDEGEITS